METQTASCSYEQLAFFLWCRFVHATQIPAQNRLLLEPTQGFKEETDMSKKKGAKDHGHDCDGHDHKEHDHKGHDHHDCGGHDHEEHDQEEHDHHDCNGHDHEERIVTLQGEDGQSFDCHVCGVFPFEGKEYVLLQTIEEAEEEDEIQTIVMEMVVEENDMATFKSIEDDSEFDRVMDFVMKVAREADEAHARGEV